MQFWDNLLNKLVTVSKDRPLPTQVTGSIAILAGEPKPAGKQDDTLLEHNVATKETKVYKYISGEWREL